MHSLQRVLLRTAHLLSSGRVQLATDFLSRWEPISADRAHGPPWGGRYAKTIMRPISIALVRMLTPTLPILPDTKKISVIRMISTHVLPRGGRCAGKHHEDNVNKPSSGSPNNLPIRQYTEFNLSAWPARRVALCGTYARTGMSPVSTTS